jgi:hypothetical protein
MTDGQVLTAHEKKAAEFDYFYNNLLGSHVERDTTIDLDALGMPYDDLASSNAPFSEEEVWDTIKRLPNDKTGWLHMSFLQFMLAHHQNRGNGSYLLCVGSEV